MGKIAKPIEGEDVRLLHRNVRELVKGVNTLTNMTAKWEGEVRGIGRLNMRSGSSELLIMVSDPGELGRARVTPPITLTVNLNPAEFGATVIFAAALPSNAYGTVQFYIDGDAFALVDLVGGSATSPGISTLESGDHEIEADYSGDAQYFSNSATLIETINELDAPAVQPFGYPNPANKDDDLILATYVLPVSPIPPAPIITGRVRFTIAGQGYNEEVPLIDLGGNTWGAQTEPIDWLNPGVYEVEARYLGDDNYAQTSGFYQQIVRALVDVTMWSDPNPVKINQTTTLHATVTGNFGIATGTIQFHNENGNIGSPVTLVGGQAQLLISTGTTARTFTFIASYSGDGNYAGADSEPDILYVTAYPAYFTVYVPALPDAFSFNNFSNLIVIHDYVDNYTGPIRIRCSPHLPFCAYYWNKQPDGNWGSYYAGVFNLGVYDANHTDRGGILLWNGYLDFQMENGLLQLQIGSLAPVGNVGTVYGDYFAPCHQGGIYAEFQLFDPAGGNYIPLWQEFVGGYGTGWYYHYCDPD